MGLPEEVGRTARTAVRSWRRTFRMCLLMLFASAAGAVFLTIYMIVLPALYGLTPTHQL
jgi:hypothetical protein